MGMFEVKGLIYRFISISPLGRIQSLSPFC
jgi:hypothetical protein